MLRGFELVRLDAPQPADGDAPQPVDVVELSYEERFKRRVVLTARGGLSFLLDLPKAQELRAGWAVLLEDGRQVEILEADEALMIAVPRQAGDLATVAWHVGNRHMNCEILADRLVLQPNPVLAQMLEALGCSISYTQGPFRPLGGAFGHGRTHSHEH